MEISAVQAVLQRKKARMTFDELCDRLEHVSGTGSSRKARCPAHDDQVSSLSIRETEDGKILLNDFAGCDTKAVAHALGVSTKDLAGTGKKAGVAVARYEYLSKDGEVLYTKVRYEPKDFRFMPYGYKGPRVPYRLPELLESKGRRVIYVEGEKDADRLTELGFVATTSGSVSDWRPELAQYFRDRFVTIIPDNDDPGRAHAHQVASALSPVAKEVAILHLPGLPAKGDVSDYLNSGKTADDLRVALRGAEAFGHSALQTFDTVSSAEPDWVWFPRIGKGAVTMVFGPAGIGKSTIMLDVIARMSRGDAMPNSVERQPPAKTIIVGIEGPVQRTREVLETAGADMSAVAVVRADRMPEPDKSPLEQLEHLESEMRKFGATVLFVDNVTEALMADTDTSNEYSVRKAMRRLTEFAERNSYAVVMISHPKKGAAFADVKEAMTGSQAFTNLPRTTLFVAPVTENGERTGAYAIAAAKSNLYAADQINTLSYELVSHETGFRDGHAQLTAPRVVWKGVIYQSAQDLLEGMRPRKEEKALPVEPPAVSEAKRWLGAFVPTISAEGMTWAQIEETAKASLVTKGALQRVRGLFLKPSGPRGKALWFPLDADVPPAVPDPAPPVPEVPAAPPQPASERLERFMSSETNEDFVKRMAGETDFDPGVLDKPPDA